MNAPELTIDDVKAINSDFEDIRSPMHGAQKQVFKCLLNGEPVVVKFITIGPISVQAKNEIDESEDSIEADISVENAAVNRARRELEIMKQIDCPSLVKAGPLGIHQVAHRGDLLVYFTEEYIPGILLDTHLKQQLLTDRECLLLARQITDAVSHLWEVKKIHRDIKPGNIIRKTSDNYVLLDLGLAFDLLDTSLSGEGIVVGTPLYFSPEQLDFKNKRQMDFRSDLFSLGIVLYESITGIHPFARPADNLQTYINSLATSMPKSPHKLNTHIDENLSSLIMRLLEKSPHMRFRSCELLKKHIDTLLEELS